jgi:periplasmic copper chaperone A
MRTMPRLLLCLALCGAVLPAFAGDCMPRVEGGWIRLLPGGMPMHAGFGRIVNACEAPVVVTNAHSPAYGSVELHETRIVDGVSRMRAVPELQVAGGGAAEMKPGGLHLMLMAPTRPLQPGAKVEIEFALQGGGTMRGTFEARLPGN